MKVLRPQYNCARRTIRIPKSLQAESKAAPKTKGLSHGLVTNGPFNITQSMALKYRHVLLKTARHAPTTVIYLMDVH